MDVRELSFLVVEDHDFQRRMLAQMLKDLRVKAVYAAADGRAALELLKSLDSAVDVVISDLDMPTMDGMEFIRHIGTGWPGTSLIIASALERELLSSVETMAIAYGLEFLGTIEKPVTPQKLQHAIALHRRTPARVAQPIARALFFTADEIAEGIENDEFVPFFQPQVDIASGRVVGAEALARWRHPQHGIVSPVAFIGVLEEAGRIDMLMRCMLRKSAAACRMLQSAGHDGTVAVNVSLASLHDVTLADQITDIVRTQHLEPRHMVLEITESAAAADVGRLLENLARLRMKGFRLAIDDYGTGYSSLAQLTRIPFTELKIDQAFVTHAGQRESAKVILASSLEMARKLKLQAVAEGVETRENWDLLRELQCDIAQGYYIARPMPAAVYFKWVEEWPMMQSK
jgi:EAL domain-containing protein (putative c-di-GMP-specific phosphodiesterase class I)/CheY-like chemotaxis protein